MKTIEDKLQAAYELGRISGASECIEDEGTRTTIYRALGSLFDGLLVEAAEDEKVREEGASALRKAYAEVVVDRATGVRSCPPDPFDFVETGEMVEKEPEPKKQTNFARITKSPEAFATVMNEELDRCPPKVAQSDCADNPDCVKCWTDWLNEEATPDD